MQGMERYGWAVATEGFGRDECLRLRDSCVENCDRGEFHRAGVGRGDSMQVREEIRSDQVLWFQQEGLSPEQAPYLAMLETMRMALNQQFFLGLLDYEGHFAIYPAGGFYKAHLDRHQGTSERLVTVILYLNEHWQPGDGGELKIWTNVGKKEGPFVLIQPKMGTMVCFLAEDYWHEVLPAQQIRMSVTGWFRQRK